MTMKFSKISIVIVDDEPQALKHLYNLLLDDEEIEIVASCKNGREAIQIINKEIPDLLFLDIQMPEINGFDVLKKVDPAINISVIFTTAYDEFAINAFEAQAVDYLLKPFTRERFYEALERAKTKIRSKNKSVIDEQVDNLVKKLKIENESLHRILVKSSGKYSFLHTKDIDWIKSAGNNICIHSGGNKYLIRKTMMNMELILDSDTFFRIHRSTIVNIDKVIELRKMINGDYQVTMYDGVILNMSRNYKKLLKRFS